MRKAEGFLDENWRGLRAGAGDPPLRGFVERMAAGESVASIQREDPVGAEPLLRWLGAFRLVPGCIVLEGHNVSLMVRLSG